MIFQGKMEMHLGCSQKVSQIKLALTSYVDPKFYGFLSRCLLQISGTNAALSDSKCPTQTLVLFFSPHFWADLNSQLFS